MYYRIGAEKGEPYFSKAETALANYKRLAPGDTAGYTEESIALQAMKRKYESNYQNIVKKKFVGTWREEEHQGINDVIRISESGDGLNVRVSTWSGAIEYETLDVSLKGGTLSFTTNDTRTYDYRTSTEHRGERIIYDKEVWTEHWKLTFYGDKLSVINNFDHFFYLNGRVVKRYSDKDTRIYVKD